MNWKYYFYFFLVTLVLTGTRSLFSQEDVWLSEITSSEKEIYVLLSTGKDNILISTEDVEKWNFCCTEETLDPIFYSGDLVVFQNKIFLCGLNSNWQGSILVLEKVNNNRFIESQFFYKEKKSDLYAKALTFSNKVMFFTYDGYAKNIIYENEKFKESGKIGAWCADNFGDNIIWAGHMGRLAKTIDGGESWKELISDDVVCIQAIDKNTVYFVCREYAGGHHPEVKNSYVLKTIDGVSFEKIYQSKVVMSHIHFMNDSTAFLMGWSKFLITTDGGKTWTDLDLQGKNFKLFFLKDVGYVFSSEGNIYRLTKNNPWVDWGSCKIEKLNSLKDFISQYRF